MPATMRNMIALAIIVSISLVEAVPYSKYGRTCNDIGCPSSEVCVIMEDPCTYSNSQCGRYPTCKKLNSGEPTCSTMNCPTGQKCRIDNGRPVCVKSQAPPTPRRPDYNRPDYNYRPTGVVIRPTVPTPPPRSSSWLPRYPGNSIGTGSGWWSRHFGTGSRGYTTTTTKRPEFYPRGNFYSGGNNHHNTHVSTDSRGNKTWRFSRNRRSLRNGPHQTNWDDFDQTPQDIDNEVGIDILKDNTISEYNDLRNGGGADFYGHFAKQLPQESEFFSRMRREAQGYPERDTDKDSPVPSAPRTPTSGYPGESRASGYPSGSGYPGESKASGYPSGSGYPGESRTSGYPSGSGYPGESKASGYPSGSGYPGESRTSGYPSGSGYPGESRSGSGYPSGSGRNYGSSGYPDESVKKTGASTVNAEYPGSSGSGHRTSSGSGYPGYPSSGNSNSGYPGYPSSGNANSGYPSSGYPNSGNPYSGYSNQGYPNSGNPYQNQNPYYNQGQNQYNGQQNPYGGYPNQYNNPNQAGRYPQNYGGQNYQGGYLGNGPVTQKPSIGDKIQEYATNLLKKVVIQKVIDSVTKNNNNNN